MLDSQHYDFNQVMVRPSYVLGGRAMEIVYSDKDLHRYINTAVEVRQQSVLQILLHHAIGRRPSEVFVS